MCQTLVLDSGIWMCIPLGSLEPRIPVRVQKEPKEGSAQFYMRIGRG